MKEKTLNVLEYDKIIDMLAEKAGSEMTRKIISELRPFDNVSQIRESQGETTEAVRLINYKGPLPVGGFYDIEESVSFARKGGTLTMAQLLKILYNMKTAERVVSFLKGDIPEVPIICSVTELLAVHKRLSEEIDRCILSEDEMSDNASGELRSIRRAMVRQNEALKVKLNHILNSADNKTMLQDSIVTMRNGRYVIPVKQEHRGRVPGIVHDQSGSGATLFIEPQAIVNFNNELRQLELDEKAEMNRILKELSEGVSEYYHDLVNNQKLLLTLDLFMAKGKLSMDMGGEEPEINEDGIMDLKSARHPLIAADKVVPIDISIGGEYRTLVITGPNTGGKTVTLKTAGLLSLMSQTGLHIPAAIGSRLPVYHQIFADIGDEQSIEQSLSTFSSHMTNIVDIVQEADKESLVLLDELGAGTDPTEGAALAIAILERLYSMGAYSVSTTHYTELKKYAISTDGVENASMEFDVETLSPTYRLIIGVPGKSNAFEISRKLGLSREITDRARELLQEGDIAFEDVISALEEDKRIAEEERDEAILINIEMKRQKEDLEKRAIKFEEQKEKEILRAKEKAREIINEAKEVSKEVQEELKALARLESMGERTAGFDRNRRRLREIEKKNRNTIKRETNDNPVDPASLSLGDRVKILTLNQNGEIISLPDEKGLLQVQVGIMKIGVNVSDIMLIDNGKPKKKKKASGYGKLYKKKAQTVSMSVDVRGKNMDDAVMDVEKYIDDAFISGLKEVTVIHGRGEGILRKGIRDMLKRNKNVDGFRSGGFNEGGDGVTIVNLK
ncbi:endonuclease MutS2 [Mogibacterium sp. NSJ-24]|jgi:DNA mismatch repair protein MutS2|uniref:Endonuclease MutS2 n=2 Tax=Lentihominibacter TaxID=2944200 RepID=A0A926I542_9FIRM|nr:endonuclease MutS2 [Lentihominibacter hominis]MBC8568499.1 endonuclease MutS2 [Lentihominibacter hominis]